MTFGCGVTLGVTVGESPPLLLVFEPLVLPLQHHRRLVQIPCRMRVQIPVLNTSFPPCEQFTNLRSSAQLGMRKLRSSLLAPIRRNPLCCLGCQLMSNRFAQLAVGIRFWMNCAICAEWRSARRLPERRVFPGWPALVLAVVGCRKVVEGRA